MATGRGFLPEEEEHNRSAKDVAVISERVWRQYFASDPGLVGGPIRVGQQMVTVVGVAERGFSDVRGSIRVDLWLPLTTVAIAHDRKYSAEWLRTFDNPQRSSGRVFGRLRQGVTAEEALAKLDAALYLASTVPPLLIRLRGGEIMNHEHCGHPAGKLAGRVVDSGGSGHSSRTGDHTPRRLTRSLLRVLPTSSRASWTSATSGVDTQGLARCERAGRSETDGGSNGERE
jgi:MacB-like periplasmic core domain